MNKLIKNYLFQKPGFLALAILGLSASSLIWQRYYLHFKLENLVKVTEKKDNLPSFSQKPNSQAELINRASRIPAWNVAAIKQQLQPSPKRVLDIKIDDDEEIDDQLVLRDRVLVIPKILKAPIHPDKA